MVRRRYWLKRIESAWKHRSVIWLSGVRRTGKTVLSHSLPDVEYFDCELPSTRRLLEDPEGFLSGLGQRRIVLDEIQRLTHPSEILKIAADHFPQVQVLATGSSTLGASAKFRDTLAGRKTEIWLTPMISADLTDFGDARLPHRLLHGGLPPFFLAPQPPERDFQEWADSYWAKDILELFRLERRHSFQKFFELLMVQSGGLFEAASFSGPCEVSRTTIANYLAVLEATWVVHVLRPFNTHRASELVAAPKVYAFDTGFVCYYRGWRRLRTADLGYCWEHYVLNELHARLPARSIHYWRDKRRHEIDFVLTTQPEAPAAIECKWRADDFDPTALQAFRRLYAKGENWLVAQDVDRPFNRSYGDLKVRFMGLEAFIRQIEPA